MKHLKSFIGLFSFLTVFSSAASIVQAESQRDVERVSNAPNFWVNQFSPQLSSLFDSSGGSELCFPSSLADILIYQAYFRPGPNLGLRALIPRRPDGSPDENALVKKIVSACGINPQTGITLRQTRGCIDHLYQEVGQESRVRIIAPWPSVSPDEVRYVTPDDIRIGVQNRGMILLTMGKYKFSPERNTWVRSGGHTVAITGYVYNLSSGSNEILLQMMDPSSRYPNSNGFSDFIHMSRWETPGPLRYVLRTERGKYATDAEHILLVEDAIAIH